MSVVLIGRLKVHRVDSIEAVFLISFPSLMRMSALIVGAINDVAFRRLWRTDDIQSWLDHDQINFRGPRRSYMFSGGKRDARRKKSLDTNMFVTNG